MSYDITQPQATASLATSQPLLAANFSFIQSALGSSTLLSGLSLVQGDVLYATDAQQIQRLAKASAATRYLSNIGTNNNPSWAAVNLANGVTGTLPEANGGTGLTALSGITTELSGVTKLSGLVSATSLAAVGTITGGTWQATKLAEAYGGTNLTALSSITTQLTGVTNLPALVSATSLTNVGTIKTGTWSATTIATSVGGTGATAAVNTANGVVVLDASGYVPDNSVDTTALKTTTGEVSVNNFGNVTMPGGTYGFYPQVKAASQMSSVSIGSSLNATSYVTNIYLAGAVENIYAQQRYVTASGEDWWLFLLIDKQTGKTIAGYSSPDHPAYGNGGNFDKVSHPFGDYDKDKHEIVLIDNDTIAELKPQVTEEKSLLTLVNEEYKVNTDKEEVYKPLHSGKYINSDGKQVKQLISTIPNHIKVRKLNKI